MKKIYCCCLSFVFTAMFYVSAQKGYQDGFIITTQNNTIKGEIDYRTNAQSYQICKFQNGNIITEYVPAELSGYGYTNGKLFTSGLIQDSFVEVLVKGYLSLYKNGLSYFVQKSEGKLHEFSYQKIKTVVEGEDGDSKYMGTKDSRWRGMVAYLIADCNPDTKQLKSLKLSERSLTNFVANYNECKGAQYIVYQENKPWAEVNYGMMAGLTRSFIQIDHISNITQYKYLDYHYTSTDPSFGLFAAISSPRIAPRLSLQPEIHFHQASFHSLIVKQGLSLTETLYTDIKLTSLSVPLSVKYNFLLREITMYFQAGIHYNRILDSDIKVISERVVSDTKDTSEIDGLWLSNYQLGYWVGVGMQKSFKHFGGGASLRYVKMDNTIGNPGIYADYDYLTLFLILSRK